MFCRSKSQGVPAPKTVQAGEGGEDVLAQASGPARRSVLSGLALAASIAAAPHVACFVGAVGALGGGYSIYSWCKHSAGQPGEVPNLPRLGAVPPNYREFRPEESAAAAEILVRKHPEFRSVVAFKQAESPGEKVGLTFLEDRDSGLVCVIVCKEGALCPCEKPQLFAVGHRDAARNIEGEPSESQAIMAALYSGSGSR